MTTATVDTNVNAEGWDEKMTSGDRAVFINQLNQPNAALDAALIERSPEPLKVVTAAELLTMEFKPREFVVDPIFPVQGLMMIHSKRGVGKTYLSLGIACAVAAG